MTEVSNYNRRKTAQYRLRDIVTRRELESILDEQRPTEIGDGVFEALKRKKAFVSKHSKTSDRVNRMREIRAQLDSAACDLLTDITLKSIEKIVDEDVITDVLRKNVKGYYQVLMDNSLISVKSISKTKVPSVYHLFSTGLVDGDGGPVVHDVALVVDKKLRRHYDILKERLQQIRDNSETRGFGKKIVRHSLLNEFLSPRAAVEGDSEKTLEFVGDALVRVAILETLNTIREGVGNEEKIKAILMGRSQ